MVRISLTKTYQKMILLSILLCTKILKMIRRIILKKLLEYATPQT